MKKHVYYPGDTVRVLTGSYVKRVGYPFDIHETANEIADKHPDVVYDALNALDPEHYGGTINAREMHRIAIALAFAIGARCRMGGRTRSLYFAPLPELLGTESTVRDKRVVMTGEYYAPSGGYDSYSGEYDYEPGGLNKRRAHVLLAIRHPSDWTTEIEVPETHVELVHAVAPEERWLYSANKRG